MTCGYRTWTTFECIAEYLHDRDYDYVDHNDVTYPCPNCNSEIYLLDAKERAESTSSYSYNGYGGTGVDIWEGALKTLEELEIDVSHILKNKIKKVEALYEVDNERGYEIKEFIYV